jgi:hypothetical protein
VQKQSYFHTVKSMPEMPGFIDVARAKISRVFPYSLTSRMPPWALSATKADAFTARLCPILADATHCAAAQPSVTPVGGQIRSRLRIYQLQLFRLALNH